MSQRQSASPDALCWTGRIPCQRESSRTVSSFHSTHHWGLPNCTPRNRDYIAQKKHEYFCFCCFKASTFAHHWKWWWGVGKTSSNKNDCCLLAAQTWTALVVFRANNSVFTVLSLPNAAQVSLLTRATTICCRRKYWTQEEEWKKCTFQPTATVKMKLPGNWSEWVSGHKELYCPRLHVWSPLGNWKSKDSILASQTCI